MISKKISVQHAKENIYKIIKEVNETQSEIEIESEDGSGNVVLMSKKVWDSINKKLQSEE